MKLLDFINSNQDRNISIFCDLDGVLAEYDIGNFDYDTIRPLVSNIEKIKKLKEKDNINVYILSICKTNKVVEEKINWVRRYMPFLEKKNIVLLSKEEIKNLESDEIKLNYLNENAKDDINIVIDDDIRIIKRLKENKNLIIYHVSSLID